MTLARHVQLKRLPEQTTPRHPRPKGPSLEIVQLVLERDDGRCLACSIELYGERAFNWSIHHRRGRDGRVDSNAPQNLVLLCGADNVTGCHGWAHQRASESRPAGYLLSRIASTDPLTVPILVANGSRWLYLTADGHYVDNPPELP